MIISSDGGEASGYLMVCEEGLALRLDPAVGAGPRVLHGCPRLRAALQGQESVLRRWLNRTADDMARFSELHDMVERGLNVSPCTQLPPVSFYEVLVAELDVVGWSSLLSISPSLDEIQLQLTDSAGRDHAITLMLPPDYPRSPPRVRTTLPAPFEIAWPRDPSTGRPTHSLPAALGQFGKTLAANQVLWDMLDDIDENVWVRLSPLALLQPVSSTPPLGAEAQLFMLL